MKNDLMLSIVKDKQIDCPQSLERTYFKDMESARKTGIELCQEYNCDVFIIRKLTTGRGHYRTVGIFNKNNEYVR